MNSPRNLAARAGRWSAQHRKTAILGWILFVVLATMAGSSIGQKELPQADMANGESKRAMQIIEAADFPETVGEQVLIQGKGSVKSDSPEVTAAVKDVVQRLEKIDGVTDIESPLVRENRAHTVSEDGRSVVVNFTLPDADEDEEKLIASAEAPLAAVAAVQKAHPEVRVEEYGGASERHALSKQETADEAKSMQLSVDLPDLRHHRGGQHAPHRRRHPRVALASGRRVGLHDLWQLPDHGSGRPGATLCG
jgi:RND superfamily putative drug exporter